MFNCFTKARPSLIQTKIFSLPALSLSLSFVPLKAVLVLVALLITSEVRICFQVVRFFLAGIVCSHWLHEIFSFSFSVFYGVLSLSLSCNLISDLISTLPFNYCLFSHNYPSFDLVQFHISSLSIKG